jgi:hypothetical protein
MKRKMVPKPTETRLWCATASGPGASACRTASVKAEFAKYPKMKSAK